MAPPLNRILYGGRHAGNRTLYQTAAPVTRTVMLW